MWKCCFYQSRLRSEERIFKYIFPMTFLTSTFLYIFSNADSSHKQRKSVRQGIYTQPQTCAFFTNWNGIKQINGVAQEFGSRSKINTAAGQYREHSLGQLDGRITSESLSHTRAMLFLSVLSCKEPTCPLLLWAEP